MTLERLIALEADPTCEMQGFIGGKRGRKDDGAQIVEVIGEITTKPDDTASAKAIIIAGSFDIDAWLNSLSLEQLGAVKDLSIEHMSRGNADFVIKEYAKFVPVLIDLEASLQPLNNVTPHP